MDELAKKVEAVLFAIGRFITLEELSKILRKEPEKLKAALTELKVEYENRDSSLLVITEAEMWKITTREEYSNIVRKIVSETELTKSQLETLAVIAFKYPIKQADLIRIRTNKAYDHLMDLEKAGFITRQRFGRSKLIRLTEKFFEYFDLPQDKLKERFKGFEQLAKTVEQKDTENKTLKEEQRKMAEEAKKQAEEERKIMDGEIEIDLQGSDGKKIPIEVVNEPKTEIEKAEEIEVVEEPQEKEEAKNEAELKLGNLEVIDEPEIKEEKKEQMPEEKNRIKISEIFTNGNLRPGESISKEAAQKGPQEKADEVPDSKKERSKYKSEDDVEEDAMKE